MGRPHIEFIDAFDIPKREIVDGPLAGTRERRLSEDDSGRDDFSSLVHFPPAWSGDLSGILRPTEILVLQGSLDLGSRRVGSGVYAFVPPGASKAAVRSADGAAAILMMDPEEPPGGDVEIVDANGMAWALPPPAVPPGIVVKRLRKHPVSGDVTWIAAVVPGWREERAEVHDTIEECFMLKGDILLGRRGVMGPGSYFWRPPKVEHGPMFSIDGGAFFFRSKGGGLSTVHVKVPEWEQIVADYRSTRPFFAGEL